MKKHVINTRGNHSSGRTGIRRRPLCGGQLVQLAAAQSYEAPFWNETLPAAGDFNVELTTHNQMSLGLGRYLPAAGSGRL